MEPAFTPSRLVLARTRRAMTLAELERRCGISSRSLTAYENGTQVPTSDNVEALASALALPRAFLFADEVDPIPVEAANFRALSKLSAKKRGAALSAGCLAIEMQEWIDERFDLPPNQVPTLECVNPETAAETVRARWGLGETPIKNVIHTLEAHGVRVFSLADDVADVDAFSLYRDGIPFVFLVTTKSAERSRFDAAHELGHLVLHHTEKPPGREAETEANRFAAALLMPSRSVLAAGLRGATVDKVLSAKHRWGVSAMGLTHRLNDLGLITEWGYRDNCVKLSRMGYRRAEPGGAARETSQMLTKVLATLRAEKVGLASIAEDLNVTANELRSLVFGLAPAALDGGNESGPRRPPSLSVV